MLPNPCVYCAQGEPPPTYGFRARCRACGREYLAPFPSHGAPVAKDDLGPPSPSRPIDSRPGYCLSAPVQPVQPRPGLACPQSAMEFE